MSTYQIAITLYITAIFFGIIGVGLGLLVFIAKISKNDS